MNIPAAYHHAVSGRARELERTFTESSGIYSLDHFHVHDPRLHSFESTVHPLTILLSLPLSVPFALLSLWGHGDT